jgi:hypothetical protein
MRRLLAAFAAVLVCLVISAPAFGFGGPNPPPQAKTACGDNIDKQTANEVTAGGGPKEGIPAPTNCDHFFQSQGYIGNGPPGP